MRPGANFCLDVIHGDNIETWAGPLEAGAVAVAALNRSPTAQSASVDFAEAGIVGNTSRVSVHSAWGEVDSRHGDACTVQVPTLGAALVAMEPRCRSPELNAPQIGTDGRGGNSKTDWSDAKRTTVWIIRTQHRSGFFRID